MIDRLVVIGLGDVTMRYLVPALAELVQAGELRRRLLVRRRRTPRRVDRVAARQGRRRVA
jgi:glucose-6-phosphate 1-dehydrogenase